MNTGVMKTLVLAIVFVIALMVWTFLSANDGLNRDEVEGRLKMALQIARERNDRKLVDGKAAVVPSHTRDAQAIQGTRTEAGCCDEIR